MYALFICLFIWTLEASLEDHFKPIGPKSDGHSMEHIDYIYMINLDQRPEKYQMSIDRLTPYTEDLRTVILKNGTTSEIREMAQTQGMKTLRQSGLMKVLEGTTTVEEILRVTLSV
jgi:hypothetical protein